MSQQEVNHGRPRIASDGTIVYPKRGWEPPPVPPGYRRKVTNLRSPDAWVFLPVLESCGHRSKSISYTACGAVKILYNCALHGSIESTRCQSCTETS